MRFLNNTTIKYLRDADFISVRTCNCLHHQGFKTLGDMLEILKDPVKLMNINGFGRKCYTEIEKILPYINFQLDQSEIEDGPKVTFGLLDKIVQSCLIESYEFVRTSDFSNTCVLYFFDKYKSVEELHFAITKGVDGILDVQPKLSKEDNVEYRKMLLTYTSEVLRKEIEEGCTLEGYYDVYEEVNKYIDENVTIFTYEQQSQLLSKSAYAQMENIFQNLCDKQLSVRGRNFIRHYAPSFVKLVPYFDKPLAYYSTLCPGAHMKKTLCDIYKLNQSLRWEFDKCINMNDEDIYANNLKKSYPFLSSNQRSFLKEFKAEYGRLPLFYILYNYIRLSEERSIRIFCLRYGIYDNNIRTLDEIANIMQLTRERVRQILKKAETQIIPREDWHIYNEILDEPFITEKSPSYIKTFEAEKLCFDFRIFACLLLLIGNYDFETVNSHVIVYNKAKVKDFDLGKCIERLSLLANSRYYKDTLIPLDDLLPENCGQLRKYVINLLHHLIENVFKLQINETGEVVLKQNHVDVGYEVFDILSRKGEPMTLNEIFDEFKLLYPEHKYDDASQLRPALQNHPNIKAIGKSSRYGLDCWKDIFFGSIRDLIIEILENSERPLHITEIFDKVIIHYPNTNINSVNSTMLSDDQSRFIAYADGHYGLASKVYDEEYTQVNIQRQRYKFEDRMAMFCDFVDEYKRYPVSINGEQEASMYRWLYNVQNGVLDVSAEQLETLNAVLEQYQKNYIPRNQTENEFCNKCQEYKEYINRHHDLPKNSEVPTLYQWFVRSKENYNGYTDNRMKYFTDLLTYIVSYGFKV